MKNTTIKIVELTKSISLISKAKLNFTLILLFLSQVTLSLYVRDFTWLASFGGLLTILGLLLIFFQSFLSEYESEVEDLYIDSSPDGLLLGGAELGDLVTDKDRIDKTLCVRRKNFEQKYRNISQYLFLTVVGTFLWAYAGFLNKICLFS